MCRLAFLYRVYDDRNVKLDTEGEIICDASTSVSSFLN